MDDFQAHSNIKWQGDVGMVQYGGGDPSMVVMFYVRPIRNPSKSAEFGRPYFDDKVFVRIHPPGERLNIVEREASETDKRRFPMQWAQFRENAPQTSDGTPIDMLFAANPSTAAALKASGVHTVEQCAALSAHAIESIGMGAQQWVNEATRYLEVANKGVKASQLKAALEDKDRQIHSLEHKVDLLETELNHLREKANSAVSLSDVQQLLANQGGGGKRGVFAPGKQLNPNFDSQTAQINATHITRDVANAQLAPKRSRARISK
jgi:hypothetical protein